MPHNYILGRELSHHFVENRLEENYIGRSNTNNIVGMKRKDSWLDTEAGNFEMQDERGGPTFEVIDIKETFLLHGYVSSKTHVNSSFDRKQLMI